MAGVTLKLDGRFKKQLKAAFSGHVAEVGILADKPHRNPLTLKQVRKRVDNKAKKLPAHATFDLFEKTRYKSFAGGIARKTGSGTNGTLSSVSEDLRKNTGINFYTRPFKLKTNREIVRFANYFIGLMLNREGISVKRVENLLQAIVRNPILRGDYGKNSKATANAKGFNRFMIDTGQLFQGIRARIMRVRE